MKDRVKKIPGYIRQRKYIGLSILALGICPFFGLHFEMVSVVLASVVLVPSLKDVTAMLGL